MDDTLLVVHGLRHLYSINIKFNSARNIFFFFFGCILVSPVGRMFGRGLTRRRDFATADLWGFLYSRVGEHSNIRMRRETGSTSEQLLPSSDCCARLICTRLLNTWDYLAKRRKSDWFSVRVFIGIQNCYSLAITKKQNWPRLRSTAPAWHSGEGLPFFK